MKNSTVYKHAPYRIESIFILLFLRFVRAIWNVNLFTFLRCPRKEKNTASEKTWYVLTKTVPKRHGGNYVKHVAFYGVAMSVSGLFLIVIHLQWSR